MCGVLCRRYRWRGSNGGGFCVNTSRRWEGFAAPWRRAGVAPAGAGWGVSCSGTSNLAVHNFRQPNQRFGASVVFFCKKKGTKENHSNLRFKDPLARGGFRRPGGEQVLRLRAQAGAFRAPARVPFFFCKKKGTKENHSNLRFKDPLARGGFRRPGGEQVLRLRAQAGAFRAPARVPFFFCKKKGTKENHLDLRSKDPLARCGSCRFGGVHSRMKCSG